nr:Chain D, Gamma-aminobutyric acid receptor subunit alpha-3 [Rattus norvegicus]4U90_E Chain E, Gamma-aminobutyric acid receptor subunit alpha-3 [Rattus norvegicus]6HSN_D Chain D, Gamma-aminobutyric acid receptor subunit alpha-3 [Rattus norvegicus]6HSN_E Chain E, Gamma-aminobutyric acid receptor subunit alpha-3 [Rattus norvegicus]
FNIVGTTYPC